MSKKLNMLVNMGYVQGNKHILKTSKRHKSMIGFRALWPRTALVSAVIAAVIPVMAFAQTGLHTMSPEGFYLVTGVVFDWSEKTRFKDKGLFERFSECALWLRDRRGRRTFELARRFRTNGRFQSRGWLCRGACPAAGSSASASSRLFIRGSRQFCATLDHGQAGDFGEFVLPVRHACCLPGPCRIWPTPASVPSAPLPGVASACPTSVLMKRGWRS